MIHKITRQYILQHCSGYYVDLNTRLFILDLVIDCILTCCSSYFDLVQIRTDMYLYHKNSLSFPDTRCNIEKCYVLYDKASKFYLYFFCMSERNGFIYPVYFTMSKEYDSSKNILRNVGSPKIFSVVSSEKYADTNTSKASTFAYECYSYLWLVGFHYNFVGDLYFVANGRNFSFINDPSYHYMGKYDNEIASYFVYDASSPYHSNDNRIISIHSSSLEKSRTGASQKYTGANTAPPYSSIANPKVKQDICLTFVPCDVFDTGIGGYYSNLFTDLLNTHKYRDWNTNWYVCDSDVLLKAPPVPPGRSLNDTREHYNIEHNLPTEFYETPDWHDMYMGAAVSFFDGYTLHKDFQVPTAAEIMYRTNDDFNYLDINSGTNYYSGMLSTLNNSTVAIPNFVSVLREPYELGTMSPVQESTFMYLVDMSGIKTGDVVEVIDNSGNKIKLICFPISINEIVPPGDKLFGMGLRLEDEYYTENYINLESMKNNRKNTAIELMPILNNKTGIKAYLGDVEFKNYSLGTILLNLSFRKIESLQIEYANSNGTYTKTVTWKRNDFVDRMTSGAVFDLLKQNDSNGDFWLIDPRKSNETLLASDIRNCGIVSITCIRRK